MRDRALMGCLRCAVRVGGLDGVGMPFDIGHSSGEAGVVSKRLMADV